MTLSHCGCTHLYVDNFKDGKKDFQIFYNDNLARKTIFLDNYGKASQTTVLLATIEENFTTTFDVIDLSIFRQIDSIVINKKGIVYPLQRKEYKGYINDPNFNR